jgi:hypothetical protein
LMYVWYKFKFSPIIQAFGEARVFQAEFKNYYALLHLKD